MQEAASSVDLNGGPDGITVVTSTNKPRCMQNLILNFRRQLWKPKELIVILNNDTMSIDAYKRPWKPTDPIAVFQLPAKATLGECLNYGIRRANYDFIAKMDDDDFYAAHYLTEAMKVFKRTGADIVGKNKFHMYLQGRKKLMVATMPRKSLVAGATIAFKKKLFPGIKFSRLRSGTDIQFLRDSLKKGCKIQSSSSYNFAAIRSGNQKKHTWKVTRKTLRLLRAKTVARTFRYSRLVSRPAGEP